MLMREANIWEVILFVVGLLDSYYLLLFSCMPSLIMLDLGLPSYTPSPRDPHLIVLISQSIIFVPLSLQELH